MGFFGVVGEVGDDADQVVGGGGLGLLGVFRTVLVCVSGCLLQVQEIAFDLVRGAIP